MQKRRTRNIVVSTAGGVLVGVLRCDDGERWLAERKG
jgi:hypothetical protein